MERKKRRYFPDGFKREAVDHARTSGLTINKVAEELGLHERVLRRCEPPRVYRRAESSKDARDEQEIVYPVLPGRTA